MKPDSVKQAVMEDRTHCGRSTGMENTSRQSTNGLSESSRLKILTHLYSIYRTFSCTSQDVNGPKTGLFTNPSQLLVAVPTLVGTSFTGSFCKPKCVDGFAASFGFYNF